MAMFGTNVQRLAKQKQAAKELAQTPKLTAKQQAQLDEHVEYACRSVLAALKPALSPLDRGQIQLAAGLSRDFTEAAIDRLVKARALRPYYFKGYTAYALPEKHF